VLRKHKLWDVCCHTDFQENIAPTLQASEASFLERVTDLGSMYQFVQSPYALSLSFLADKSIIGRRNDDTGMLKYNLNLDEHAVKQFYQIIQDDKQVITTSKEGEEEHSKALQSLIMQGGSSFKQYIDEYITDDDINLEAKYQIALPYVLRGLLIHLMNDALDSDNQQDVVNVAAGEHLGELIIITQSLASLLNCFKEAGVYFERYLQQLSLATFSQLLRRLQW
jgi:hypothetical protein